MHRSGTTYWSSDPELKRKIRDNLINRGTLALRSFHVFLYCPASSAHRGVLPNLILVSHPSGKELQDLLPGIINQLGSDNLDNLRKLAEQFQMRESGAAKPADADDDEVPELVSGQTFEAAANEEAPAAS